MVVTREIALNTKGECDTINITQDIEKELSKAGISTGVVTIFVAGSTAGITTTEYEPGVMADLKNMWERIIPRTIDYAHNRRWGDGNGYSHVRASLLGASLNIPFQDSRLMTGTWQQIVLVDFDNRPRSRRVILQIVGD